MTSTLAIFNPTLAIFIKELRQHGVLAVAMVFMCLLFQVSYLEGCYFTGITVDADTYFSLAIVLTALYAGAAAALAYSTEHANNTFIFLRKMPISPLTIALGKGGWVLGGTLLVLLGNVILAAAWTAGDLSGDIWIAFGFGIVEALVWGFFWSTRCRNQVEALLAGYICAAGTIGILGNLFQPINTNVVDAYISILPYRAVVAAIVAFFAARGMMRWFEYETKSPLIVRLFPEKMTISYPQEIQTPFLALVHQHIRHASFFYPFGVLCCIIGFLIPLTGAVLHILDIEEPTWGKRGFFFPIFMISLIGGMALFWATIFGHDQKNDSYRFLSRLGIHEGKVWWSRMVPALLFYLPVMVSVGIYWIATGLPEYDAKSVTSINNWEHFWAVSWLVTIPMFFIVGLAPAAVGAFISISIRSQIVAIALGGGLFCLLMGWAWLLIEFFGCSPWWTTLPLVFALLIASRIRAGYWLRETFTWRSRFIPLIPVFVIMLAVMVAIPVVRVYSIPYVSWEEVESYFAQIKLREQLPQEERLALFRYVMANHDFPPESRIEERQKNQYQTPNAPEDASTTEKLERQLQQLKERDANALNSDEQILQYFVWCRNVQTPGKHWDKASSVHDKILMRTAYVRRMLYWEMVRMDRLLRIQMIKKIVEVGGIQDEKALAIRNQYTVTSKKPIRAVAVLDEFAWESWDFSDWWQRYRCFQRLELVFAAVNCWHNEHGALPESLDLLVGTYLDALPVDPATGELPKIYFDSLKPEGNPGLSIRESVSVRELGLDAFSSRKTEEQKVRFGKDFPDGHRGTYLQLGNRFIVIIEPLPEPELYFPRI